MCFTVRNLSTHLRWKFLCDVGTTPAKKFPLNQNKYELERQKIREEIQTRMEDVMDNELICAICAELMVQVRSPGGAAALRAVCQEMRHNFKFSPPLL